MKCRDCAFWIECEGFERKDDVGGCTYPSGSKRYMPMFLDEECNLKEPYKTEVIKFNKQPKFHKDYSIKTL